MLDVMLCLPKSSWGVVLDQVARKIGTRALRKIIVQACDDSESHSPGNSAFEPSPPRAGGHRDANTNVPRNAASTSC